MRGSFLSEKFASHWGVSSRARERISTPSQFLTRCLFGHSRRSSCVATPSSRVSYISRQICKHNSIRQFTTCRRRNSDLAVPRPATVEEGFRMPLPKWSSAEEEAQYRASFFRALKNKQPNQMIDAMADPRSVGLVGSLTRTMFLDALVLLSPAHFVEPYRHLHHMLHEWGLRMQGVKRLEAEFDDFTKALLAIMQYRVAAGYPPELDEYTHLLACAREMGNGPLADELWKAMHCNDIVPSLVCYNHYMAAKIWDHCYIGKEAYNLHISKASYRKRRSDNPNPGYRGYGTGARSLKRVVLDIFSEMSLGGLAGDEETYVNVLLAAARVGDRRAVENILKAVWNVDVAAVMSADEDCMLPEVMPFERGSPLHPTERLLFAVAHAFGTNNDADTALTIVEFIAYAYELEVPANVWYELFERTYVLSAEKTGKQAAAGQRGQVAREVVHDMFWRMTEHNTPATLPTYRFLTQLHRRDGNLAVCKEDMRKAYDILSETRAKRTKARDAVIQRLQPVLNYNRPPTDEPPTDEPPTYEHPTYDQEPLHNPQDQVQYELLLQCPLLAEAIHQYDLLRLEVFQQTYLLRRMTWAVVKTKNWFDVSLAAWELQERPKFREEWQDFLPEQDFYDYEAMNSGTIEFRGNTKPNSHYMTRFGLTSVRRSPDHPKCLHPVEEKVYEDRIVWAKLLQKNQQLDITVPPLSRLFTFQLRRSHSLEKRLERYNTYVEYPEDHPLSATNNPTGGFFGRIRAMGFEFDATRAMYWQATNPWDS